MTRQVTSRSSDVKCHYELYILFLT